MAKKHLHYRDDFLSGSKYRLPVIMQSEAAECGLAVLAMVSSYYGYQTDLLSMRRRFSVSSHGLNLKNLIDMAGNLGFSSRALQLELSEVKDLQLPCILHWDMNHFVVLKSVNKNKVIIHDPASGESIYSLDELGKHFTGVALELTPTSNFKIKNDKNKIKIKQLINGVTGLKRVLLQIFALSALLQIFSVIMPFYMQIVVDDVIQYQDGELLILLVVGFGLVFFLQLISNWVREYIILYLSSKFSFHISSMVFNQLIHLPMDYFEKRHTGDIISRFDSLQKIKEFVSIGFVSAIVDGLMAIVILAVMLIYNVWLTLLVIFICLFYISLRLLLYAPLRLKTQEAIAEKAKHDSVFIEVVRSIQTIKIFQKENDRQNIWKNHLANTLNSEISISKWNITYDNINKLLFGVENLLVIYLAANSVMDNLMSLGMLYAFINYKSQFVDRVNNLTDHIIEFKMLALHLDRLSDIVLNKRENTSAIPALLNQELSGKIEVKNLSYRYGEADLPVFEGVSFTIQAGETVAIVGASGAGKTTLIKCLMGLLVPTEGEIIIDDKPLKDIFEYRKKISGVMQDDQLFNGSIYDNIACFSPDIEHDKVIFSAKMAAIHDDIKNMPMEYNTLVGDMGSNLSGGQKQRIMLSRALYSDPKIMFLDEATSNLDIENESYVSQNIKELNITRVIVAHRPETISSADRVIEI